MRNRRIPFALLLVGLLVTSQRVTAKNVYVSPEGNDAWSGQAKQPNADRTDGPVATLTGARNIVRQWKKAAPLAEPVHVIVAGGVYQITAPLVLTPQDLSLIHI